MFLATFLIGLREGLEATLIVGILAAFIKRAGKSVAGVVAGALLAALVSVAVGVALNLSAQALPQAQQEALETVIGAVAVVFVTTMILWMNTNSRALKGQLEGDAQRALSTGGQRAMVGMSFLAVLKEGFETAVFLLAVFNSSHESAATGVAGAVAGVVLACVIGYLIYKGGTRFNLHAFFNVTGPFLILVAAGFVANCFRTAHEAGWVNIGQAQVFSFPFLSSDSVLGALVTGMFSIQPDPRLIEVIAWVAYLVPVMIIYLWPTKWALTLKVRRNLKLGLAGVCAVAAVALFVAVPRGEVYPGSERAVAENASQVEAVSIESVESGEELHLLLTAEDGTQTPVTLTYVSTGDVEGMPLDYWEGSVEGEPSADLPADPSLNDLLALNGGKLPKGLSLERTPGPFEASWTQKATYKAYTTAEYTSQDDPLLLDVSCTAKLLCTLTGGGIDDSKILNMSRALDLDWAVEGAVDWKDAEQVRSLKSEISASLLPVEEQTLYWLWIPSVLGVAALALGVSALVDARKARQAAEGAVVSQDLPAAA